MTQTSPQVLYDAATANRALPLVRSIVRDLVRDFRTLREDGREQEVRARRGRRRGAAPDDDGAGWLHDCSRRIEGYRRELEELGLEARDLESGYVDFPTLQDGRPAYLCWRLGEDTVRWWHVLAEGCAERRPIPHEQPSLPLPGSS